MKDERKKKDYEYQGADKRGGSKFEKEYLKTSKIDLLFKSTD